MKDEFIFVEKQQKRQQWQACSHARLYMRKIW
jgi:hypothetical protein